MANASYDTKDVNKAETISSAKDQMRNSIKSKGLTYLPTLVKAQLNEIVKEQKEPWRLLFAKLKGST